MRNAAEALSEQIAQGTACIMLKTRVVHHVQVGQSFCRTALNIHVIDNGEGIPKELTDSIFYPLVSGKEQGSGLGLSLVQTFVEQHGGSISVSSEAGRTDFSHLVSLIVMKNVWIVDDDRSIRWVLEKALQKADIPAKL